MGLALATASSHEELLSAKDISTILKLTPRAVRSRMDGVMPSTLDGIQRWPVDVLPPDYIEQLRFAKKRAGAWTYLELIQQVTTTWKPKKKLSELPEFSQTKARRVRTVMVEYLANLDAGMDEKDANHRARQSWLFEFSKACSARSIYRWAKRITDRGNYEYLPLEAFADEKAVEHPNARLDRREKNKIPFELIRAFKAECVKPDQDMAGAYRKLEMDWMEGKEVAGVGLMMIPRQPFPFTFAQMRNFAPSAAAREQGNRGKAAARRNAIPHMERRTDNLRLAEIYVMDDTRINVTVLDDLRGKPVELKVYLCMEVATRRIVGYVMREAGSMRATDVDALQARVMRTCGIAHRDSGYSTLFLFERGTVACSGPRKVMLESMFPGQLHIHRTGMDGGQNFGGDFVQANSGHWMGKGWIESFMKTLGHFTRHLPGQRGSVYQKLPAMVGDLNNPHKGGQIENATLLAQASRVLGYLESGGTEIQPHAQESVEAHDIKLPLLFTSQFRQAFQACVAYYNDKVGHRREGFNKIGVEQPGGGLRYRTESSNEKWQRLEYEAEQRGCVPQRISPADAAMLLMKAQPVTVTKQGATITLSGDDYRYNHPASLAVAEAQRLSTLKKEYIALVDPDYPAEIYLLKNQVSNWNDGDTAVFLECLPLVKGPDANDPIALAREAEQLRQQENRIAHELVTANAPFLKDRVETSQRNVSKILGVTTTTGIGTRPAAETCGFTKAISALRIRGAANAPMPSRHEATSSDIEEYIALRQNPTRQE